MGEANEVGRLRVEPKDDAGHVLELRLDRPAARNAISTEFAVQLHDVLREVAARPGLRAAVLSSTHPESFCVGADLKQRNTFTDDDLRAQREVFRSVTRAMLDVPVPMIAAVEGHALGGGFELALLCDLVIAGDAAMLGLPEVSVGVVPGMGGTQLLARRIGPARAGELIYTARHLTAVEAAALGAIDRVVPAGSARPAALQLAATIAGNSPVGVRQAKRAIRAGLDADLSAGLDIEDAAWRATAFSADRAEGIAAFNARRRPIWPG